MHPMTQTTETTHTHTDHNPSSTLFANHSYAPDSAGEAALLERCKQGDQSAWDTLIRRYEKSVYKFAYSLCRNHEEAGDIAGQVFLRLYQNLHTFRNEASFTSWLFRIVRNTYLDLCVRPAHRSHLSLDANPNNDGEPFAGRDILDPSPTPEARCMERETAQLLAKAIRHLPAYQRQVLRMYHSEGKSYEEIADATGLSIGTVKSRLNRARNMLRERLAPYQEALMAA
ncbi:MAG TPA: sigma-70 family RNA polymerase sigma factor [Chthonomonadaceae bacterium]|nr:sigma-70 family RNA polymerase sigma factor [Chthonomonadaceae bacterium]